MTDKSTSNASVPDITSAYISGDSAALKSAIHDRVVAQVQGYVSNAAILTGKQPVAQPKK